MKTPSIFPVLLTFVLALPTFDSGVVAKEVDVCVYTATPSGILAAIAVKKAGHSVVIVEPGRWVGGMLGAGLKPMQDCPNYAATGGMTKELLLTLGQSEAEGQLRLRRDVNPMDVLADFEKLLEEYGIEVLFNQRVASCAKDGASITSATFDLAPFDELGCPVAEVEKAGTLAVRAKMFIDASYEGDLMAKAGVGFRLGRESEAEFGEEHAGVQPPMELAPIDPFVVPGKPESGLLDWVEDDHWKPLGSADQYTQAYNYRYYTTDNPKNRIPITPPEGYDAKEFELVGRYVEYLVKTIGDENALRKKLVGIFPGWKNSGEWNYQRSSLFSMSPVGISQEYAGGDYATKAKVWKKHQDYLRGLHQFMSTDSRVPEAYRKEVAGLGLDGRLHQETQGWPHQLYIRISRRLHGRYTITAHDVYNRTEIDDPIGLAQYGIDTYPSRRIWFRQDGQVMVGLEGKMFIGGSRGPTNVPYPIPYRAITPNEAECTNLLVPVCFSATHLGYASARMEPVFMICGESAGIAACLAIEGGTTVQGISRCTLQNALTKAGQKLAWDKNVDQSPAPANDNYSYVSLLTTCDLDKDKLVSKKEWEDGKKGWEWLFPHIDKDGNGTVDDKEYAAFQAFKKQYPDWLSRLRKKD